MKLKTRRYSSPGYWKGIKERQYRAVSMPQFASSLAAEHAADAAHSRCSAFRRMKAVTRLERKPMSYEVTQRLFGADI